MKKILSILLLATTINCWAMNISWDKPGVVAPYQDLCDAIMQNQLQKAKFLVAQGTNPDFALETTMITAHWRGIDWAMQKLKLLFQAGVNIDKALELAFKHKETEIVKRLIELGANPDKALIMAITSGNDELAYTLMQKGANTRTGLDSIPPQERDNTIKKVINPHVKLVFAIYYKKHRLANRLIEKGTSLEKTLYFAAFLNLPQVMIQLLNKRATINAFNIPQVLFRARQLDPITIQRHGLQNRENLVLHHIWNAAKTNADIAKILINELQKKYKIQITKKILKKSFLEFLKTVLEQLKASATQYGLKVFQEVLNIIADETERAKYAKIPQEETPTVELQIQDTQQPIRVPKALWGLGDN